MKANNGYKKDKPKSFIGKWLKRYFEKRTVRRFKKRIFTEDFLPDNINKVVDENFWDLR